MSYLVDLLLVLALLFFLFLPISDRRTVLMRLGMIGVIIALFAASVATVPGPELRVHLPHLLLVSNN